MERKVRWVERGKTLLILLLSLSALYLLSQTELIRNSGWLSSGTEQKTSGGAVELTAAARPSSMAVNTEDGRWGIQYDQSEVDAIFGRVGPLLGAALTGAGEPVEITREEWESCLRDVGIYFDFGGETPLDALRGWLGEPGGRPLSAAARRMVLTVSQQDQIILSYQNAGDGRFYSCRTEMAGSLHLLPEVRSTVPNGAYFAFEADGWERNLLPYTMITENRAERVYNATVPLTPGGDLSGLLKALDYTGGNHAPVSDGEVYVDGNARLRVLNSGWVICDATQEEKYPVPAAERRATIAEAIEAAGTLAENTIGASCGEAELYLISAEETENGYRIQFGYRLDGSAVWLYDEGWAAQFEIQNGYITEFALCFRSYAASDQKTMLLPMERAAVMLPDLTGESSELICQYRDTGESRVAPVWVAR